MTALEKFMSLEDKDRETFLAALCLFSELDATYRQMMKQSNFNSETLKVDAPNK